MLLGRMTDMNNLQLKEINISFPQPISWISYNLTVLIMTEIHNRIEVQYADNYEVDPVFVSLF